MTYPEYPTSDAAEIKAVLVRLEAKIDAVYDRLDGQANGINSIGSNMQWMVEHMQGIFQMFASPQFMSQMTNMLMGGIGNAGQAGPEQPASGPAGDIATGADAGTTGVSVP